MTPLSRNYLCGLLLIIVSLSSSVSAQRPKINVYRVRVVTEEGTLFRGVLNDIDETYLFVRGASSAYRQEAIIPLVSIRKVVLRRSNNRSTPVVGAILGGLLTGYLSAQSLQKSQASNAVAYGLTLSFATAGGAAGGLLVGVAIGNVTRRVVRPLDPVNPNLSLLRQLEPFSIRYQQDLIDRLPSTN